MDRQYAAERLLTEPDFARLLRLGAGRLPAPLADALQDHDQVAREDVPPDRVTLDSKFEIRDLASGVLQSLELCDPDRADIDAGRLSVLAPLGAALLGLREGMVARWSVLGRKRAARVERIVFQPEADGPRPVN